jgi:hypothetical protein
LMRRLRLNEVIESGRELKTRTLLTSFPLFYCSSVGSSSYWSKLQARDLYEIGSLTCEIALYAY